MILPGDETEKSQGAHKEKIKQKRAGGIINIVT
jgi:hypothetical protein